MLDADQVLSIFCYLIVGARVDHLHTHIFILDHFATSHYMMSMDPGTVFLQVVGLWSSCKTSLLSLCNVPLGVRW